MKDKVVVFTENNARILINPAKLDRFDKQTNAIVNPDLLFVAGLDPHYWRLIKDDVLQSDDIEFLSMRAAHLSEDSTLDFDQRVYYRHLHEILEDDRVEIQKAQDLVSRLLKRAHGKSRSEIYNQLVDKLPDLSQKYAQYISRGIILPMDDEQKKYRDKHIKKNGAVNDIYKVANKRHIDIYFIALAAFLLGLILMRVVH